MNLKSMPKRELKPASSSTRLKNVFRMITNMWHTYIIYVKYILFPVQP